MSGLEGVKKTVQDLEDMGFVKYPKEHVIDIAECSDCPFASDGCSCSLTSKYFDNINQPVPAWCELREGPHVLRIKP